MKVCELVSEWLTKKGITHAFGIIGGGNVALWDAIARNPQVTLVSVHHEQAAAMAAAAFQRVSGRPALCLVTTGAGSTNAVTGVMAAWMDSVPLMVISGNDPLRYLDEPIRCKGTQAFDQCEVVKSMTKIARRVTQPENTDFLLNYCLTAALAPREGPVWLDIPKDIQVAAV